MTGAKKLVFYARGQEGGEVIQVKFATLHGEPYGDSCTTVESRWLELTRSWTRYEVDLSKVKDASRIVTPFSFVTNVERNSRRKLSFFLDEILVTFR